MVVLSDLSNVHLSKRDGFLMVAEHTGVSLFRSWTKVLLAMVEDADQIEKYYFDRLAAVTFREIADKVFQKTGWQVCRTVGGNWKTPLLEKELKHTSFTMQEITPDEETGPVRIFHGSPEKVVAVSGHDDSQRSRIRLITGGIDGRGEVYLSGISTDIPLGTTVFVVVELYMGKNKRHPIPYARLPEPGPFSGWEDLNRIGS
jgi:hypothetical protein